MLGGLTAAGGIAGFDAMNSVNNLAQGLPIQLAETANAFRGDLAQHATDLRGQLAETAKPFSEIGDALKPFAGMASGVGNFVKSNPWLLPLLLGGVGGGLLGGRPGAVLGGIGAPLAYLASTGQLGNLGEIGEKFKGLLGQSPAADPAAGMAATAGAGTPAAVGTANRLNAQAQPQSQTPAMPVRSELTANQL
jgi:hypothetical protein